MTVVDLLLAGVVIAGVVGGYRLGFITRVTSWVGMAIGLFAGVKALPAVLARIPSARGTSALALTMLVLGGLALAGQAIGFALGQRIRPRRVQSGSARIDRVIGGVAGAVGALAAAWLVIPLAARTPGTVASLTTNSASARWIDDTFPDPPDALGSLQAVVGDGFPKVFDALRPTPELGPPPERSGLTQATADRVAASVVKIQGVACNRIQDGTGFVVSAPGGAPVVVTNAHVVAGEDQTQLQRDDGTYVDGTVIAFDPARDLAVLVAPNLDRPPLPIGEVQVDTAGGVFGHPGGEPLRIAPFRVAAITPALGRDIYDAGLTSRQVLELSAALRPGDSGSALIDPEGRVVGVAFAIAPDRPDVAYALAPAELRAILRAAGTGTVDTGPCVA